MEQDGAYRPNATCVTCTSPVEQLADIPVSAHRHMHPSSISRSNSSVRCLVKMSSVLMKLYSRRACAYITSKVAAKEAALAPLLMIPQSFRLMTLQGATLTR